MRLLKFALLFNILFSMPASALLEVSILKTKEAAFPIVIAPFEIIGESKESIDRCSCFWKGRAGEPKGLQHIYLYI